MKKSCIIFGIILLFSACNENIFTKKIVIKGKIGTVKQMSSVRVKAEGSLLNLSDAARVLVCYGNKYELVDINEGAFSVKAPQGSATCLVFLNKENQYIGNLFSGGMNVLPLVNMNNATTIDLSLLTADSTRILPTNDPVGSVIRLSTAEIAFLQSVGAYYQTLSKNLDMDNDNSPDILDGDQIRINSIVNMQAGIYGTDKSAPEMKNPENFTVNYGLRIAGDISMYDKDFTVSLKNPTDNSAFQLQWDPIKADPSLLQNPSTSEFILIFNRNSGAQSGGNAAFENGTYNFKLNNNQQYSFMFSNVSMQNHMMIIRPVLHADADGFITHITYDFVFPDGSAANPESLIQGYIRTQLNDNNSQLYEGHPLYGTFSASDNYDYYSEKITRKVSLNSVVQCNFAYIDILGNEYEFSWRKNNQ